MRTAAARRAVLPVSRICYHAARATRVSSVLGHCFGGRHVRMDCLRFLSPQLELSAHHELQVSSGLYWPEVVRGSHNVLRKDVDPFQVLFPFRLALERVLPRAPRRRWPGAVPPAVGVRAVTACVPLLGAGAGAGRADAWERARVVEVYNQSGSAAVVRRCHVAVFRAAKPRPTPRTGA